MQANIVRNQKKEKSIGRAFASRFAKSMFLAVCGLAILSFIGTRMFTHIDLNLIRIYGWDDCLYRGIFLSLYCLG